MTKRPAIALRSSFVYGLQKPWINWITTETLKFPPHLKKRDLNSTSIVVLLRQKPRTECQNVDDSTLHGDGYDTEVNNII